MTTLREDPIVNRRSSTDELVDAISAGLQVLRDRAGEPDHIPAEEIPSDTEAAEWVREVWTDRGGDLRPRRSLAKGASGPARSLRGLMRWHSGSGNLEGLMLARFTAGSSETFEKVSTLDTVTRIVAGAGPSRSIAAWQRTGLVD